ncbi:hypothetical protein [Clostridium sulfidigenes]|uniref:hypothetical protein n=1 Tax=Clostridium sulfidigenes TaxID=318464 RepID=UPI003F88BADE
MNQNIEVINKCLIGVRFSLIPIINQINYEGDISENNPFFLSDKGIIVLNKDQKKMYPIMKKEFSKLINKSNLILKNKLAKLEMKCSLAPIEMVQKAAIRVIIESKKLR